MEKYTLTIEQIQNIIDKYLLGDFCEDNCFGCCGDNIRDRRCSRCIPKLKNYLEGLKEHE